MKQNVEYVRIYFVCLRIRIYHHKFNDFLKSIFFNNEESFTMMTMNLIIDLSFVKNSYMKKTNDFILMLINKFIKFAIYVATFKIWNAKKLINLLWREFICHYNMICVIIFNHKFLFTSKFWKILCWFLNTKRKLSIAFYSQIDEQIENQNPMFEHDLRVYCNYKQNNWLKLLFMTCFTYNNNVHSGSDESHLYRVLAMNLLFVRKVKSFSFSACG